LKSSLAVGSVKCRLTSRLAAEVNGDGVKASSADPRFMAAHLNGL